MKRLITVALAIFLLLGCVPVFAAAAKSDSLGMAPVASTGYVSMTTSQQMLDVIKVLEGFHATPYWDNSQWTVGYGSRAESSSMTVTPEQAEQLLITQLQNSYEKDVNQFCRKIGKQPTQNQFDALVSFTYNLGSRWMNSSRVAVWLKNPTTEHELVDAMIQWCRSGSKLTYGLTQRRIREAIVFMKGEYYYHTKPTASHNVKSNLRVVANSDLPYYTSVIYQYDYSTSTVAAGNGHAVGAFIIGGVYDTLEIPTREGYRFAGWKITKVDAKQVDNGSVVTAETVVQDNLELTALWVSPDSQPPEDESGPDEDPEDEVSPENPENPEKPENPINPDNPTDEDTAAFPFKDVSEKAWYRENVQFVYENKLMNGMDETAFNPEGTMTRGMLVTVLYRMDGSPDVTDEQRKAFDDIADAYYTDAVAWAKENGIVNGVTQREFRPNDKVTREQAVAIFYRYCVEYCKVDSDAAASLDDAFADTKKISGYAVAPMQWAVAVELITGQNENGKMYLNPKGNLSRCQSAAILMRCVQNILV